MTLSTGEGWFAVRRQAVAATAEVARADHAVLNPAFLDGGAAV